MKKIWKTRRAMRLFPFEKCGILGVQRVFVPSKNV